MGMTLESFPMLTSSPAAIPTNLIISIDPGDSPVSAPPPVFYVQNNDALDILSTISPDYPIRPEYLPHCFLYTDCMY